MHKLLIIDDEAPMRRLLRINLEDRYKIVDTGDSDLALQAVFQSKPNAILLDLRMPDYSGFELCRTFNSLTSTQLIPLIIVSGESGGSTKAFCKELGAGAYFEKPIDFEALKIGIANLLRAARPERRSEVRVRLRVMLKLRGTDREGKPFEEASATENVSKSSFLCGCTAPLIKDSPIEVHLITGGIQSVGKAQVVRSENDNTPYPRYAFRFAEKAGDWVLR